MIHVIRRCIPAMALLDFACFSPFTGEPLFEESSPACKEEIAGFEACSGLSLVRWLECDESGSDCVIDLTVDFTVCFMLISDRCYEEYQDE